MVASSLAASPASAWRKEAMKRCIGIESDAVLQRCISYAESRHMGIDTFCNKFEAWALSHLHIESSMMLNSKSVDDFLSFETNQLKENVASNTLGAPNLLSASSKIASPLSVRSKGMVVNYPVNEIKRTSSLTDVLVWPANSDLNKIHANINENMEAPEISLLFDTDLPGRYMRIVWPRVVKCRTALPFNHVF